jgi:hypothetical protein
LKRKGLPYETTLVDRLGTTGDQFCCVGSILLLDDDDSFLFVSYLSLSPFLKEIQPTGYLFLAVQPHCLVAVVVVVVVVVYLPLNSQLLVYWQIIIIIIITIVMMMKNGGGKMCVALEIPYKQIILKIKSHVFYPQT